MGSVSKRLEEFTTLISDKGTSDIVKLFLNMVEEFILKRQNVAIWVTVLTKMSDVELPEHRIKILSMLNDICANCSELLSEEAWLECLKLLEEYMHTNKAEELSSVVLIMEIMIQQCMHSFSNRLIGRLMNNLVNLPLDGRMGAKLKYKLCGLLWTMGEKQK